jgi:hypothetical protein
MAITMQGNWTVSVKTKNAAFAQRFIIAGATSGNGTYAGETSTPAVTVVGNFWTIRIQHNPGSGFVDSDEQIKFPTTTATQFRFDIESNDSGADKDFDDLVLTCSAPRTPTDFVIFGNVSWYKGRCLFNPCNRRWIVIDTVSALQEALRNPVLRKPLEKLYPERLQVEPRRIGPLPDPPPFRPLVLPLEEVTALPAKQAQLVRLGALEPDEPQGRQRERLLPPVLSTRLVRVSRPVTIPDLEIDRIAVGRIIDQFFPLCQTGPLPGTVLRFFEYDRTAAELAGGPYTGTGARELLGLCVTDANGNYIFRFSRAIADFIQETNVDVAPGEDEVVQSMPDVIVQVVDTTHPSGYSYESAPYWNVPLFKRINICVPLVGRLPTACQGQHAIQAIGNIFIGAPTTTPPPGFPPGYGPRVGFSNVLNADGKITARNSLPNVPQARCAAWGGLLDLFACFIDQPGVTHYTIRHRKHGTSGWSFFQEKYTHPKIANIAVPGYSGDPVGPFDVPLRVDGGAPVSTKAYLNIESDNAWVLTHRNRKAVISSWLYSPEPGSVDLRIEGYDAAGNKVAGADDTVTLYILNEAPDFVISDVSMAGAPGSDCALFTVPAGAPATPLTVQFKVHQPEGFLHSYGLTMNKGNLGGFPVTGSPAILSGSYAHGDDHACSEFHGTLDTAGATGLVTVDLTPAGPGGRWLDVGQPFCTFVVNLDCSTRVTNGYNTAVASYGPKQYFLGMEQGT